MSINFFVVNLERDVERLISMQKQFEGKKSVATLHIIKAIDGKTDKTVEEIYNTKQGEQIKHYGHILSHGEIACFLSHQKALKEFLESGEECSIILEDDAILTDKFWNNIQEIANHYKQNLQDAILNFRPHKRRKYFEIEQLDGVKIVKHLRIAAGAVGYMVSRSVAQALINQTPILSYDKMLQKYWQLGIKHYATVPKIVDVRPVKSSICQNSLMSRPQQRYASKQQLGFIKYKLNKGLIVFKHDYTDLSCNIKQFGFFKTIKALLSLKR